MPHTLVLPLLPNVGCFVLLMYVCILNDYDIFRCPSRHLGFVLTIDDGR